MIYAALSRAAEVTTLVSDRIYPDILPQSQGLPAAVYARIETEYLSTIHSDRAVAKMVTLEVWCFAETRPTAESVADAVETALAQGQVHLLDRRFELDTDTQTYAVVITCRVWA